MFWDPILLSVPTSLVWSLCLGRWLAGFSSAMFGSIQVSGDAHTPPWVRSRVWVGGGLELLLSCKGGVGGYIPRILWSQCSSHFRQANPKCGFEAVHTHNVKEFCLGTPKLWANSQVDDNITRYLCPTPAEWATGCEEWFSVCFMNAAMDNFCPA